MICKNCNTQMLDNAKFCPECGQRSNIRETAEFAPGGLKICPQCGTENPSIAKFCKKDGFRFADAPAASVASPNIEQPVEPQVDRTQEITSDVAAFSAQPVAPAVAESRSEETAAETVPRTVQAEIAGTGMAPVESTNDGEVVAPPRETSAPPGTLGRQPPHQKPADTKPPKNRLLLAIALVLLIVCAGGGLSWYFLSRSQTKTQQPVEEKATSAGAVNITDTPSKNAQEPAQPVEQTPPPAASPGSVEQAPPPVASPGPGAPDTAELEKTISNDLRSKGIRTVSVKVNQDMEAVVTGVVSDGTVKANALAIVSAYGELKGTRDNIRIKPQDQATNPATTESELNRSLKNKGMGNITAKVNKNMVVTLKGTVQDKKDKNKALSLARGMKGIKGVQDIIFVVGP